MQKRKAFYEGRIGLFRASFLQTKQIKNKMNSNSKQILWLAIERYMKQNGHNLQSIKKNNPFPASERWINSLKKSVKEKSNKRLDINVSIKMLDFLGLEYTQDGGVLVVTCVDGYESYTDLRNQLQAIYLQIDPLTQEQLYTEHGKMLIQKRKAIIDKMKSIEKQLSSTRLADTNYTERNTLGHYQEEN